MCSVYIHIFIYSFLKVLGDSARQLTFKLNVYYTILKTNRSIQLFHVWNVSFHKIISTLRLCTLICLILKSFLVSSLKHT